MGTSDKNQKVPSDQYLLTKNRHTMKKTFLTVVVTGFMIGTMLTGCQTSNKNVEKARDNMEEAKDKVTEAKNDINQALKESIQQFKKESQERISNNEKIIAEFKGKMEKRGKVTKANYEKKVAELEQNNREMKMRLDKFEDNEQDKWDSFKSEFNHDMDELGKALKDLTIDNTK
jgi:predicted RNase H-like HicB family nuclease